MKYLRETIAVAQRILAELWCRKRSLIFWAIFPVLLLILNSLILQERLQIPLEDAYTLAAPSTLVGAALFFSGLGGSLATVVSEREQHTLKRLFLSPLGGVSYFLGICLAYVVIGLGQTVLMYSLAFAQGATFEGSIAAGLLIVLLSMAAYVGVGFVLGTQLARRTEDVNSLVAAFGIPLMILGGAFMPTDFFPESLINLTRFNPIFHMIEAMVGIAAEGNTLAEVGEHVWFLGIFAVAMVGTGWLSYQRMVQVERQL
ncbi:ABC transporter substrate-binding protein [Leptolyngbya sp. BL0902]|uniref:ABC transporter permease n=1 Tax=Leptolyngbya sp. BL0902 TaxID=1115757 RepID=UPI0018E6F65E|nr:ABC transporter permease [Leptolyngbya sp. BL0902]QQE63738.1 ABC transporter substrate-binding protein [Leptolyngbya sp. BL0902]